MNLPHKTNTGAGHTLVELIAASTCSVILLGGLASVMLIAGEIANTPSVSAARIDAAEAINELASELRFATIVSRYVDEEDEQSLEFVVVDRNDDGCSERIRYDWPLHPDPDERDDDDPPQLFKTVTVIDEDGNGEELVTYPVTATAELDEDADPPFRVELIETSPAQSPRQFTHAQVQLRTNNSGQSQVEMAIRLLAHPEFLSAILRADFNDVSINPTSIDLDASGDNDWLHPAGEYTTNPLNDFTTVTVVEGSCRDTSSAAGGPRVRINADRVGGTWGSIGVRVERQSDGSQTLTLFQGAANTTVQAVDNLSADAVHFRIKIIPSTNRIWLYVNNEDVGPIYLPASPQPPYTYTPYSPTTARRFVAVDDVATASYNFVEVRVAAE